MDYIAIARKEIESNYDSVCDIIEQQSVVENNITKIKTKLLSSHKSLVEFLLKIYT